MGQHLCPYRSEFDTSPEDYQNPSLQRNRKNSPKITCITIDQIAEELFGDSISYSSLLRPQENLSFQVTFNTFWFEKLSQNETFLCCISLGDEPDLNFRSERFTADSNGNAIILFNAKDIINPISKVMIDYYSLAICPQHCEFVMRNIRNDKVVGKVTFEIEFQQVQEIQIVMKDLKCKIDGKVDKPYYALFKALTNQETAVSKQTATQFGDFDKKKNKTEYHWGIALDLFEDPTKSGLGLNQGLLDKDEEEGSKTVKNKKTKALQQHVVGGFDSFSPTKNLEPITQKKTSEKSRFMLKHKTMEKHSLNLDALDFYRNYSGRKGSANEDDIFTQDLTGQCYICFQKLLKTELRVFDRRDSFAIRNSMSISRKQASIDKGYLPSLGSEDVGQKIDFRANSIKTFGKMESNINQLQQQSKQQVKKFSEKISVAGKNIGKIKGQFKITNIPILQQMGIGILTEKGIVMTSAPVLMDNDLGIYLFKKSKTSTKVKELQQKAKKLKELDSLSGRKVAKSSTEKESVLTEIVQILQVMEVPAKKMFLYDGFLDLIAAQQILIELGFHCLMYSGNVRYELRHYYHKILTLIFDRGELRLPSVGFLGENQLTMVGIDAAQLQAQNINEEQVRQERIKIARFYQKLLYSTLEDAINKFCRKGIEIYLRAYIERFFSVALFRIPDFRKIFIECILKKSNKPIDDWAHMSWNIDDPPAEDYNPSLSQFFEWNTYFYDQIPECYEKKEAFQILLRITNNDKWQLKLQKRTQAFFEIICKLVENMHYTVNIYNQSKQSVFWQDIPGYPQILKAFLLELKDLEIVDYPDALKQTYSVYDSTSLTQSFDLITKWITLIDKRGEAFPSNFDFNFYFTGIQISLDKIDHDICTCKVLWSLYKTISVFPLEQRLNLALELLRKYFYRFFFHWSHNIREVFYMILLFQVEYNLVILQTKRISLYSDLKKNLSQAQLTQDTFDYKSFRKQQTINLEEYFTNIQVALEKEKSQNDNQDDDYFSIALESHRSQKHSFLTQKRTSLQLRDIDRKQNLTKLIQVHKLLKSKLDEISFLAKHIRAKGKNLDQLNHDDEEYTFESDDQEDNHKLSKQEKDEIKFNRILNKIPEELRVYAQDRIFKQYERIVQDCETWKKKNAKVDDVKMVATLPDLNVDNQIPLDDSQRYASPDQSNLLHLDHEELRSQRMMLSPSEKFRNHSILINFCSECERENIAEVRQWYAHEKAEQEQWAKEEFVRELEELKHKEGITEKDIEQFKKTAIIKKSIDVVKQRAQHQAMVRHCPTRYSTVKSKVARCIKVQKKVAKKNKTKAMFDKVGKQQQSPQYLGDLSHINPDSNYQSFMSGNKQLQEALSVEQLRMSLGSKGSPWQKKREEKVNERNRFIQEKEQKLEQLKSDLSNKKLKETMSPQVTKKQQKTQIEIQNVEQSQVQHVDNHVNEQPKKTEAQFYTVKSKPVAVSSGYNGTITVKKKQGAVSSGLPQQQIQSPVVQSSPTKESHQPSQKSSKPSSIAQAPTPQQEQDDSKTRNIKVDVNDNDDTFEGLAQAQTGKMKDKRDTQAKFQNLDLEAKTAALQDEFDQLLGEMLSHRQASNTDGFYEIMNEFYSNGDNKHASPTKRLITLKDSTFDHKKVMKDNIQKGDYALTYCSSPGKSYIIEPHGGALNYKLAEKDPLKFYDQVFNQDITKHKVKQEETKTKKKKKKTQYQVTSKVTKRPHLRIMEKIKQKLVQQLQNKLGSELGQNIMNAINDNGIEQRIKMLMKEDKIKVVNERNQPLFQKQITQFANYDSDAEHSHLEFDEHEFSDDAFSPEFNKATTKIAIQEDDLDTLENEIKEHIRRNSTKTPHGLL